MLVIRLSRMGKKKQPTYRVVVQEKTRDPWGTSIAIVGHYNPRSKETSLKADNIKDWISKGAQPSPTVHNILVTTGIITKDKVKNTTNELKHRKEVAGKKAEKDEAAKAKKEKGTEAAKAAEEMKEEVAEEKVEEVAEEKVEEAKEEVVAEKTEEKTEEPVKERVEEAVAEEVKEEVTEKSKEEKGEDKAEEVKEDEKPAEEEKKEESAE